MSDLFELERWDELEQSFRCTLENDPTDARTAFRLANLLVLLSRFGEAVKSYEVAWTQRWPGHVCLNNMGVALARDGEARAAIAALRDALSGDEKCAPAAYNLGVLYQFLSKENHRPGLLAQLDLVGRDGSASDLVKKTFEAAVEGVGWGEGDSPPVLDGPLYLWQDDLSTGFGFEPKEVEADVDEGYRYYEKGLEHLRCGRWQEAIDTFESAQDLHPSLESRIVPHRTRAQVALAKEYRGKARRQREEGDFAGASNTLNTYYRLASTVPDQALAEELLLSEIRSLGENLRQHEPSPDWRELQTLISMARQRVEDLGVEERSGPDDETEADEEDGKQNGDAAAADEDDGSEAKDAERTESDGGESDGGESDGGESGSPARPASGSVPPAISVSSRMGDYIRGLCRDAWSQQLRYLTSTKSFDEAELMLTFSELQWFAQQDLPRWRRDLYTAKAEALASEATEALSKKNRPSAIKLLNQAREAATETGDSHLTDRLDRQLASVERRKKPREDLGEMGVLFDRGEYLEVLRQSTDKLEESPDQPTLRMRRESALERLKAQIRGALDAHRWQKALDTAGDVLKVLPDESEVRDLAQEARQGLLAKHLDEAENALADQAFEDAETACDAALGMDPDNARARELRLRSRVGLQVKTHPAEDDYEKALIAFEKARAAGQPQEAFTQLLEMRKVPPTDRPETRAAAEWLVPALVAACRRQLEQERTPEKAGELMDKVRKLLNVLPDDPSALELQEDLRREKDGYGAERRRLSLEALDEVRQDILDRKPEDALTKLEVVEDLDEPSLRQDAARFKADALAQIGRRIERLAPAAEPAEDASKEAGPAEDQKKLEALWQTYRRRASPAEVKELERRLERLEQEPDRRRQLRDDFETIRAKVDQEDDPLTALKLLYQEMLARRRSGHEVLRVHRKELAELKDNLRAVLGPLDRWKAWLYERYHRIDELFEAEENDDQDTTPR